MSEPNKNNSQDLNNPEYWESMGIKPIVIDPNNDEDVKQKTGEIAERIKDAVEDLKKSEEG